jgi:hypothetical protein
MERDGIKKFGILSAYAGRKIADAQVLRNVSDGGRQRYQKRKIQSLIIQLGLPLDRWPPKGGQPDPFIFILLEEY